jgi:hypothetical protein
MVQVRRVVVDVLKPHDPSPVEFADALAGVEGVEGVTVSLVEHDREVQNVEVAAEGEALDYAALEARVEQLGGTVHSVDQVSCGDIVVESGQTARNG